MVAVDDARGLHHQVQRHRVKLVTVQKAAVLRPHRLEGPFDRGAQLGVHLVVVEVLERAQELLHLPDPARSGVEHGGPDSALEVGAVLRADDAAVAVPGGVDLASSPLLECLDDLLGLLADDLVLHADHVPVVDLHAAEIDLGLGEDELRGERGAHPHRGQDRAALQKLAPRNRSGKFCLP